MYLVTQLCVFTSVELEPRRCYFRMKCADLPDEMVESGQMFTAVSVQVWTHVTHTFLCDSTSWRLRWCAYILSRRGKCLRGSRKTTKYLEPLSVTLPWRGVESMLTQSFTNCVSCVESLLRIWYTFSRHIVIFVQSFCANLLEWKRKIYINFAWQLPPNESWRPQPEYG